MKLKKAIALGLAGVMVLGIVGCGAGEQKGDNSEKETAAVDEKTSEVEEIVFATPLTKTVDMAPIADAINEITEEKIGVRVKIEGISMANYSNQIGLMMSGDEQLDIMGWLGTYSSMLAKNQLRAMDDVIDEYGKETKELLGEEFLKSTTNKGTLYGLPNNNGKAAVANILIRKDLINELSLPVDQLKQAATFEEYCENLDLLTEMFAKIHEAHPEMACLVPVATNPNSLGMLDYRPFVDGLNDGYGVLMSGEDSKVENLFATEEFKTLSEYAYQWNQAGYILEDASTTQESYLTYTQNDRTAAFFIRGEEGQAEQVTTGTGVEVEAFKILEPYIVTSDLNGTGFAISATSKHPEAAMKFINEMYTNEKIANLLAWGIEGTHYQVLEDGTIAFPEGVDANNTTYGLNMDWFFGNQFLTHIWGEGRDTTIYSRLEENNKKAEYSPVIGFSYDNTSVSTEIAALTNVYNQYYPGFACGTLNPETELPKFLDALDDAGLQKVIDEKQKQLDEWKKENK